MILEIDDRTPGFFVVALQRIAENAAKLQFANVTAYAHELEGASMVCLAAILKGRIAGVQAELEAGGTPTMGRIVARDTMIREHAEAEDQGGKADQSGKGGDGGLASDARDENWWRKGHTQ